MADGKFDAQSRSQMVETTLDLLDVVSTENEVSQRGLAERLGVALGLTNAVLKRCVRKGLLKVRQAPARRYAYYLTPKGFKEKSRLTAEYLYTSLTFYRDARQDFDDLLAYCANRGWRRVALVGVSELSEIATLAAIGRETEVVGILDGGRNETTSCGLRIFRTFAECQAEGSPDIFILTTITDPQAAFDSLAAEIPHGLILTPKALRISRLGGA
mgnify:CR=1 FL=1|tara:strand:+ start:5904 stop:6548 length:645 start_codon:yes stop_codon:yes gene_type:complete